MKVWTEFLNSQIPHFGKAHVEKWAQSLKVVHFDAANIYLEAQNSFQICWFEEHLRPLIKKHLRNNNNRPIKVHLNLKDTATPSSLKRKQQWKTSCLSLASDPVSPHATFDMFFPGNTNRLHFELLRGAIQSANFNPLYIQGAHGSGKTHLLMACAHAYKDKKVFYIQANTFTQHLVQAIQSGLMQKFRESYRQHDVLLIDDIQDISDRVATQEELFHTFNSLHIASKQIILSGIHHPKDMKGIEPRLTSRFEWGLILNFHCLEESERYEYIELKLQQKKFNLPISLKKFIAKSFSSIHLILSALDRIEKKDPLFKMPSETYSYLNSLQEQEKQFATTPEKILKTVAETFSLLPKDLLGRQQAKEYSTPRQIAIYLCRFMLRMSFIKIGKLFQRDHSTIITSVKTVEKKLQSNDTYIQAAIEKITSQLRL